MVKTLFAKGVVASTGLLSTQVLAHHSAEADGTPLVHVLELASIGVALVAIALLVLLLLKPAR